MKIRRFRLRETFSATAAGVLLTVVFAWGSGVVEAQTCLSPQILLGGSSPVSGNTCGGEHIADVLCAAVGNPGPNTVFAFALNGPSSGAFVLASGTDGFVPVMYLSSSTQACDVAACLATGEVGAPISVAGLGAGSYRLIIAATPEAGAGSCGAFTLSYDIATIDRIFADGFDRI